MVAIESNTINEKMNGDKGMVTSVVKEKKKRGKKPQNNKNKIVEKQILDKPIVSPVINNVVDTIEQYVYICMMTGITIGNRLYHENEEIDMVELSKEKYITTKEWIKSLANSPKEQIKSFGKIGIQKFSRADWEKGEVIMPYISPSYRSAPKM